MADNDSERAATDRAATDRMATDVVEALRPLDVRSRAMFGGYCIYVDDKVIGLVCDGALFVKRSPEDALFAGWATLAPAYPGARESWRLPAQALSEEIERVHDAVRKVADSLPARTQRKRSTTT